MLLTVWLKRQDIQLNQTRALVVAAAQGKVEEAFNGYLKALYPWFEAQTDNTQKKLVDVMQKWTAQGPVHFRPVSSANPLRNKMKEFTVSDEFREKLRAGKKGLRR